MPRFNSAVEQSGLLTLAHGNTNVMVVMVEAMGQPTDASVRAQLERIWLRPEFSERFDVSHGDTPFFGSTTSAELRELCGRWGAYEDIVAPDPSCLPAMFRKRGYGTTSYHAFTSGFFDRKRWYPRLGFDRSIFGPEMQTMGAAFCPNVFAGACDRDVPKLIGQQLKQAEGPQFIYWLTLNSHLPIVEDEQLGTAGCRQLGNPRDHDFPMICRILTIWDDTAGALSELVTPPDFPPTDILIVGDHMPPFTHQKSRLQFSSDRVPWILLKHRGAKRMRRAGRTQGPVPPSAT